MTDWIFPSNPNNVFDVKGAFAHNNGFVDWTKGNTKVRKGDTVYLYASSPVKSIIAITVADKTNVTNEDKLNEDDYWLDDIKKEKSKKSNAIRLKLIQFLSGKEFSYDELQNHGLNSNVQSKIKANKELALYLEDSVSNFKKSFEWIDFHEELSKSFLKYKDNREEFYKLVKDSFEIEGFDNPFDDKLVSSDTLDPFSIFSAINKDLEWEYKKQILENLKRYFSLTNSVYNITYQRFPSLKDEQNSFILDSISDKSETLWELLEFIVLENLHEKENQFIDIYDELLEVPNIKSNLTILLSWVQPRKFLALDTTVKSLIEKKNNKINSDKNYEDIFKRTLSGTQYVELLKDVNHYLNKNIAIAFDFPTFYAIAHESEKETINYQSFYDFKPYHGQKYVDPRKADDNQNEMADFKKRGQLAREEFQKVINMFIKHLEGKSVDKITNWVNQGQVGHLYYWTFIRESNESKNTPAIAISLSEMQDHIQWTLQVDVLDYQADENDIKRQNQVLSIPLKEPLYYWVEDFSGQYFKPERQDREVIKAQIQNKEIKKVQVKYDVGNVEDLTDTNELIEKLLDGYEKLLPYYSATKKVDSSDPSDNENIFYILSGNKEKVRETLETGEWSNGLNYLNDAHVGDKVALAILRKHNYPYNDIPLVRSTKTSISGYNFHAIGEIEVIDDKNKSIGIKWEEFSTLKRWYLFTYAHPVWKIDAQASSWQMNLNNFLFHDESQNFNLFLNGINWKEVSLKKMISYNKDDFLDDVFIEENEYLKLINLLKRKRNIILQGPPGVGKTFMATRLAYSFINKKSSENVKMIQFHQSYSYEDFIEGIKPTINTGGFLLKDGVFKEFVQRAQANPQEDYFFIIDEINRGNISKVFGELLMLIEGDKRGEDYQIPLQYSDDYFYVPKNIYIIGMMNTADKGLAMMDYALRRRFAFYEINPALENDSFKNYIKEIGREKLEKLRLEVIKLNKTIHEDASLGKGFEIGHSYLTLDKATYNDDVLIEIIEYEIVPLLNEYWFDDPEKAEGWRLSLMEAINE